MRKAVIDVGTNSVLLLCAETDKNKPINILKQEFRISGLGTGMQETGILTDHAMEKTLQLIKKMIESCKQTGIDNIRIIGTEALRIAQNRGEFCEMVFTESGCSIDIISGDDEAKYTYLGSIDGISADKFIVADVGGGSTEIILGDKNNIRKSFSVKIGAVFLAEKFTLSEKLDSITTKSILDYIKNRLSEIYFEENNAALIGVGGTISTLAMLQQNLREYDPNSIHGYLLNADQIWHLYNKINRLSYEERVNRLLIEKGREQYILYGILIFIALMEIFNQQQIVASDRGVRFGVIKTGK
ncbi:MAG: Ppx/GppA family phosphatase [Calditrichaeota bacterium]|nr:Ppx/GppA family phosphatase [Calditrichota bacterium]